MTQNEKSRKEVDQINNQIWDYIVVGTGLGGSTVGFKLAQAGFSVLFIEKGLSQNHAKIFKGQFAEMRTNDNDAFLNAGRSSAVVHDKISGRDLTPLLGSGVGGSSAIYGAVLQRFKESDFKDWPISYQDMIPYYEEAEKLYRVYTSPDYQHVDLKYLNYYLLGKRLAPYILPKAHDDRPDCGGCQSYLCASSCKNDAWKICLKTAIESYNAQIITSSEVTKIEMAQKKAVGVRVQRGNENFLIRGKNVILSAGALFSPLLLLQSLNEEFPRGIGNSSGFVGRFLMRHFVDLYALKIDSQPRNPKAKELGFDDFYRLGSKPFGTVQSFGRLPPMEVILRTFGKGWVIKLVRPLLKIVLNFVLKNRLVMSSILVDSPQFENRVWRHKGNIYLNYQISKEDQKKIEFMRTKLKSLFEPFGCLLIKSAEKNEMLAHVCGTCRMGTDPKTSVVHTDNKVHETENVYVIDSSFFPTSGGTNPGLTIIANALRVADLLISKQQKALKS
jgi:choline dehydrogenase-like flavoprotein